MTEVANSTINGGALTAAAQDYITAFGSYLDQFSQWGHWLFYTLAVISTVLFALWCAFEKASLVEGTVHFIKRFWLLGLFFTLMIHQDWLTSLTDTANAMGYKLTNTYVDPSSIISEGIGLANKIIIPVSKAGILSINFGFLIVIIAYVAILIAFINVALQLAITKIITNILIVISPLLLAFGALDKTRKIAENFLETLLSYCIKLLAYYLVIAAGSKGITNIVQQVDMQPTKLLSFDVYAWIIAAVFLFWLMTKNVPDIIARIVSQGISEIRGGEVAAVAMAVVQAAKTMAVAAGNLAAGAAQAGTEAGTEAAKAGVKGAVAATQDLAQTTAANAVSSNPSNALTDYAKAQMAQTSSPDQTSSSSDASAAAPSANNNSSTATNSNPPTKDTPA